MRILLALLLVVSGHAQTDPDADELGSISGRVFDGVTGEPMPDVVVRATAPGNPPPVTTDAEGRYRIEGLAPRRYGVHAGDYWTGARRRVTLRPGQDLKGIDLRIVPRPSVSGRVLDDQDEPIEGAEVSWLMPEYSRGEIAYFRRWRARTDDEGRYELLGLAEGKAFVVRAQFLDRELPPLSETPADPQARRAAVAPTYYPNALVAAEATPITLRPGERRENVDIRMLRTPSLCLEAEVQLPEGEASFWIEETEPDAGIGPSGGLTNRPAGGEVGPDGKLRICGLHRGEYRLTAFTGEGDMPDSVGVTNVTMADRDVTGVQVVAQSSAPLTARIEWVAEPPEDALDGTVSVTARPRYRVSGPSPRGRVQLPGAEAVEFPIIASHPFTGAERGPLLEEHAVQVLLRGSQSVYVADVRYGGRSVYRRTFTHGDAIGDARLRVLLAHDGATLDTTVVDEDGQPLSNMNVYLIPEAAASHVELAETRTMGTTDQDGVFRSGALAPGTYRVVAVEQDLRDYSPSTIETLWNLRRKGYEITLAPSSSNQAAVERIRLSSP